MQFNPKTVISDSAGVFALLQVLADPKRTAELLTQLADVAQKAIAASDSANAQLSAAVDLERKVKALQESLVGQEKNVADREIELAAKAAAVGAELANLERAKAAYDYERAGFKSDIESAHVILDRRAVKLDEDTKSRSSALDARQEGLNKREKALDDREHVLAEGELDYKQRVTHLKEFLGR